MSDSFTQEVVSEDTADHGQDSRDTRVENERLKLVPLAESIRYRKRAQSAEKKLEELSERLADAKAEAEAAAEQLKNIQVEQKLMNKLTEAGAVDLETAMLLARVRIEGQNEAEIDGVVKQLRKEKQYLFADVGSLGALKKTAGVRERMEGGRNILERAARRAATTGNRTDLQEYLKLRRNFV